MSYYSLNRYTNNNNVRVFLSLLNHKIKQLSRSKMLHWPTSCLLFPTQAKWCPLTACYENTSTIHMHKQKKKKTLMHSHTYTYVHFWLTYYNITNLGFQWRILQKPQNYLTVVISYPTHNVCIKSQGTFLMVDQLPNTGVKYFPPVMKIINFQSGILYFACI
jgi:hypothetical protein